MVWELLIICGVFLMGFGLAWRARSRRTADPFVEHVDAALSSRFPRTSRYFDGDRVMVREEDHQAILPLAPLRLRLSKAPDRQEHLMAHFLAEADRALHRPRLSTLSLPELEASVLPVPLPDDRAERTDGQRRLVVQLDDGLTVGFSVGEPASGRWVTRNLALRLEVEAEALWKLAVRNLWQKTDGATVSQHGEDGEAIYRIHVGDGLEASRLLLEPLWSRLSERAQSPLLIAVPSRDRVYAVPSDDPEAIDRMLGRTYEDWMERPHHVSCRLWMWSDGHLAPWVMHA